MIKISSNCYGCTACMAICPTSAIAMHANAEGFLFPQIDAQKCIGCDLCQQVCSEYVEVVKPLMHRQVAEVMAAWSREPQQVAQSTSGGLFARLAEQVLLQEGVVYGVAWRDSKLEAYHKRIDSVEELPQLKGSKYVQSHMGSAYQEVQADLKRGCPVLFSGTPCQVAGLRLFLRKPYPNLITVDLVCHGVPSPKLFAHYIDWLEQKQKGAKVSQFKFRDKKPNQPTAFISWQSQGKRRYYPVGMQPYSFGFYRSYFSRESCFNCYFSQAQRVGDITLSDFWGGEKVYPQLLKQRTAGFNMVMCNSTIGEQWMAKIQDTITAITCDTQVAIDGDIRLRESNPRPPLRDEIYSLLNSHGFDYIQKNYLRPKHYWLQRCMPNILRKLIRRVK